MADTKITNLASQTAATGDELPINRAGVDGKVTAGSIIALSLGRLSAIQTYTTTGNTWSKPAGLSFVIVECQGAGGGGAGSTVGTNMGSGGGAGGYARKKIAAASLGATETLIVGTGGALGTSGGAGGIKALMS